MACDEADAASEALANALAGPKSVSSDAGSMESHSLRDLIAAEKYQRAKCAARNPFRGIRITQLKPPGAV